MFETIRDDGAYVKENKNARQISLAGAGYSERMILPKPRFNFYFLSIDFCEPRFAICLCRSLRIAEDLHTLSEAIGKYIGLFPFL